MYLSTVFYRKKDLYTISDIEIFIFYFNLMTLGVSLLFFCPTQMRLDYFDDAKNLLLRLTRLICRSKSPLLISSARMYCVKTGTVQE